MKVRVIDNLSIKKRDGHTVIHQAGDVLNVPDRIGQRLIQGGRVRRVYPPLQFFSKFINKWVWLTNSPEQSVEFLKTNPEGVIYTSLEYYHLKLLGKKKAFIVHEVKRTFPGSQILAGAAKLPANTNPEKEGGEEIMRRHEAFPTTYLSKEDLDTPRTWTIENITMETLSFEGNDESKPVLYFAEQNSKPLVLNSTNWGILEELYGEDSEEWAGFKIELFRDNSVMFGKKKIGGIRVRKPSQPLFNTNQFEAQV